MEQEAEEGKFEEEKILGGLGSGIAEEEKEASVDM